MTPRIALLRAVNVGGTGRIAMAELKALADDLGLNQARTLLNSGNLVFGSDRADADLEQRLEAEARARLGVTTDFMVRGLKAWRAMIAANPFPDEARDEPGRLLVHVFKTAPAARVSSLRTVFQLRPVPGTSSLRAIRGGSLELPEPSG